MPEIQVSQLSSSQPASKQDRKDCSVSLALQRIRVRRLPQPASLFSSRPVSEPYTQSLDAFHTANAGGQLGTEQASVAAHLDVKSPSWTSDPEPLATRQPDTE